MSFLNLEVLKETHKFQMNNDPCKAFESICFWDKDIKKQRKIAIHMDL
jgi:hypothetical protein